MSSPRIVNRTAFPRTEDQLVRDGLHPVLARIFAARGVRGRAELEDALAALTAPEALLGADRAALLLADAIAAGKRLLIVADYDCDGATACALGVRVLRSFGADIGFIVPDRFRFGYGLTPEIVALAAKRRPDMLITVDNGIASVEGVDAANRLGMQVVITDHHLPGAELPRAAAIVNPNQPGCAFPSKNLAGVGVMFYVMVALRTELRRRGAFANQDEPKLADLLDLAALGTVADVVRLDQNNRILVAQGLRRIRAGRMQPGLRALLAVAGRDPARATSFDLGFMVGPRLNAAGRLDDMSIGIECLLADDYGRALGLARQLDDLNKTRRSIEADMQAQADLLLEGISANDACTLALFDPAWHQGVIGILAGRVKDRHHRPVFAFARGEGGEMKGSGRSIAGVHLRDALDLVAKRAPGMILRFGGHAAAAGLTLRESDLDRFSVLFEEVVRDLIAPEDLEHIVETDGSLEPSYLNLDMARMLESQIWGQGFPQPLFCDEFEVINQRVVGERHLKLRLARAGRTLQAMRFQSLDSLPGKVRAAYRLSVNEFNGAQSLQLIIEHWQSAA